MASTQNNQNLFHRVTIAFFGIVRAFKEEKNFRIQLLAAIIVVFFMIALGLTVIEKSILLLTIFVVLSLELVNSQIEKFLDLIQPELHVRVKKIKDFSAGAVLISVIGSVVIGILILLPHIKIMDYDLKIFEITNGLANQSKVLNILGIFFANYIAYFLGLVLLVLLFWPKKDLLKNRQMIFVALVSGVVARFLVKTIIVFFYHKPRPYVVIASAHKLIHNFSFDDFQSFPSGHAIFFFAISTALYFYNKKLGIMFFTFSIIIGIARVFVGVHWPSDILAGTALGMLTAWVVQHVYLMYKEKVSRKVEC